MRYYIVLPATLLALAGCVAQSPPATYAVVPAGTVVQNARIVPPAPGPNVNPAATTTYLSPPYVVPSTTVVRTQ
jgi:hypothetical protein